MKMTIDEVIKERQKVIEVQERLYEEASTNESKEIIKSATDNDRQLVEWLTELKQWHRVYGVCPSYEMCIPECKEGYNAQIAEYKRLLKSAIDEWHIVCEWGDCSEHCEWYVNGQCSQEWSNKAEALKLIGDEPNGI